MTKTTATVAATETKTEVVLTEDTIKGCISTASKIRACLSAGATRGATAKFLGIRYQWVRNVQLTPLKKVEAA